MSNTKTIELYAQLRNLNDTETGLLSLVNGYPVREVEETRVLQFSSRSFCRCANYHKKPLDYQKSSFLIPFDLDLNHLDKTLETLMQKDEQNRFPFIDNTLLNTTDNRTTTKAEFSYKTHILTITIEKNQKIILEKKLNGKEFLEKDYNDHLRDDITKTSLTEHEKIEILHHLQKNNITENIRRSLKTYAESSKIMIPPETQKWHHFGDINVNGHTKKLEKITPLSETITLHKNTEYLVETLHMLLLYHTKNHKKLPFYMYGLIKDNHPHLCMSSKFITCRNLIVPFTNLNTMVKTIQTIWKDYYDPKKKIFNLPDHGSPPINAENIEKTLPEGEDLITFNWAEFEKM